MSAASRQREADRKRAAYCDRYQHGFPTFAAFRAWQIATLALWRASVQPAIIAANEVAFAVTWEAGVPATYPEPPLDSPPFEGNTLLAGAL